MLYCPPARRQHTCSTHTIKACQGRNQALLPLHCGSGVPAIRLVGLEEPDSCPQCALMLHHVARQVGSVEGASCTKLSLPQADMLCIKF